MSDYEGRAKEKRENCYMCGTTDEACTASVLMQRGPCCPTCGGSDTHPRPLPAADHPETTPTVPFSQAEVDDEAYTYESKSLDEFGWITDLEYFDERWGEVKVTRKTWRLVAVEEIVLPDPYPVEDDE